MVYLDIASTKTWFVTFKSSVTLSDFIGKTSLSKFGDKPNNMESRKKMVHLCIQSYLKFVLFFSEKNHSFSGEGSLCTRQTGSF